MKWCIDCFMITFILTPSASINVSNILIYHFISVVVTMKYDSWEPLLDSIIRKHRHCFLLSGKFSLKREIGKDDLWCPFHAKRIIFYPWKMSRMKRKSFESKQISEYEQLENIGWKYTLSNIVSNMITASE